MISELLISEFVVKWIYFPLIITFLINLKFIDYNDVNIFTSIFTCIYITMFTYTCIINYLYGETHFISYSPSKFRLKSRLKIHISDFTLFGLSGLFDFWMSGTISRWTGNKYPIYYINTYNNTYIRIKHVYIDDDFIAIFGENPSLHTIFKF